MTDIQVLNLGADGQFKAARQFVEALVSAHQWSHAGAVPAEVSFLSSNSRRKAAAVMSQPLGLLHVMAHGAADGWLEGKIHFTLTDWEMRKVFHIDDVADWVSMRGESLKIDAVLLDACSTYSPEWISRVQSLLTPHQKTVLIGSTEDVYWDDAMVYVANFYGALLRRSFPATPGRRRASVMQAHQRSASAFKEVRGRVAPFKAVELSGAKCLSHPGT